MVGCIGIHLRPVQNWTNFFVVVFSAWINMGMEDKVFQKLNKYVVLVLICIMRHYKRTNTFWECTSAQKCWLESGVLKKLSLG